MIPTESESPEVRSIAIEGAVDALGDQMQEILNEIANPNTGDRKGITVGEDLMTGRKVLKMDRAWVAERLDRVDAILAEMANLKQHLHQS